jgi:hypothetical protein
MAHVFHFAVSIIWTSGTIAVAVSVSVTTIIVAVTTFIFVRRVIPTGAGRRRRRSPATGRAIAITTATRSGPAITTGIKAPRRRRWCTCPLSMYNETAQFANSWSDLFIIPQSLAHHPDRGACYASHDTHHPHRDDSHTPQMQSC